MKGFWYSWENAQTGESYGESDILHVAKDLAEKIANKPLIAGEMHPCHIYQEPGHRLIGQVEVGNKLEMLEDPEELAEKVAQMATVQEGILPPEMAQKLRDAWEDSKDLDQKRRDLGLPQDAWHKKYWVVEDGLTGQFIAYREGFSTLRDLHQEFSPHIVVRDSRTWQVLK